MKTPHTPGPWIALKPYHHKRSVPVAILRGDGGYDIFVEVRGRNAEANAQLIAQAPAMIEALQRCKAIAEDGSLPPSARLELIRDCSVSIIVKATETRP